MRDICVRVDEGLFRKVTDFAREAGISRGAVLRQLAKKRFECETMRESLAESLTPMRESLAEPRTPSPSSSAKPLEASHSGSERVGSWQRYVPTTGSRASYLAQSDAHREYQILGEGNNPADFA